LPLSIGPGSYYIGAIADYANAVTESDETNNALLGNQITLIGPDLSMANVSAPTSASVGGTVTIRNTAAAASGGNPGNFSVGIYLSVDDVITTYDMMIGSRLVTGLTAGSSDTADTAIVLPGSIAPGTYYIGAIADYRNDVKESDETNNALTGNRITIFGPDLTISAVSGPSSAVTGGSITISTTLAASASGGSAGESEIHIYLSADSTVTSSDIYLGSRTVSSLAPGTTNTGSVTALVPQYVTPGTYYIGAIADSGDTVKEPDETNNSSAGNQIAIIGPDLSMTSVSGPSTAALGETIAVTNTVTAAAGGGYPNAFTVGIYLSADATIDSTDYRVGTRTAGNLAPGQSSTEATAIVIPTTLKRGTYYIGAIADDGNSVKESNEGNNNLTGNTILIKR
jgi:subtilase family serine protease